MFHVTAKGKTHQAKIVSKLLGTNELMIVYYDDRSAPQIAADWDSCETVVSVNELGVETSYDGFSRLMRMVREDNNEVYIGLTKEVKIDA